jgi:hypothetical protein
VPVPTPTPTPIPEPTPAPTPAPTPEPPTAGYYPPQDAEWDLLNDERGPANEALANRFLQIVDQKNGVIDEVLRAIKVVTGCVPNQLCPVGNDQAFFAKITAQMRADGYGAGQFESGQDGIAAAPPMATKPEWSNGLWVALHLIRYKDFTVAWGSIQGANGKPQAVYAEHGGVPGPTPTPTPGPEPTPTPTPDPDLVASASIKVSKTTVKPPAKVEIDCFPKDAAGKPLKTPPDVFFIGAQFGGPINAKHISETHNGLHGVLTVNANSPAGVVKANCSWYAENHGAKPKGTSTPNAIITVKP